MSDFDTIAVRKQEISAITRQRHLAATVRVTRLIGILFVAIGGLGVLLILSDSRRPVFALTLLSTLVITPGVLYVIAGVFLKKRRYWAWMTTVIMTLLLLLTALTFSAAVVIEMMHSRHPDDASMPATGLACMVFSLTSILISLRKCLPAVLESEQQAQHGFAVIPVAHLAPPTDQQSPRLPATSPYSSQPDP